MTAMKIAVDTQLPAFANDIADVIRIFGGEGAAAEPGDEQASMTLCHKHEEKEGIWKETVTLSGEGVQKNACRVHGVVPGELEAKRYLKRLVKQTCYDVMKAYTGRSPAWGSLTGIRPTRLFYQALAQGRTVSEAQDALIREFDLSSNKADLLREIVETQRGLTDRDPARMDLYIGIPFCTTRCSYCSFSSGEIGNGKRVEPYLAALLKEIRAASRLIAEYGCKVDCCYIGGGTPSSLSTEQLDRLLTETERCFPKLAEWTVEAGRPDTLDEAKLSMIRRHPVTRISINPQTINDETLRKIGRAHTAADFLEAFCMARRLGFENINTDIIAALPGEDLKMFEKTLDAIRALKPESLTVHTLAVKRSSKLHEQRYQQTEHAVADMVDAARACAGELGMKAYYLYRQKYMADNLENVGYCLPEAICRYNIDNMEETTSVLAVGSGGISKFVPGIEEKIVRVPNVSNIEQYIERIDEMIERKTAAFKEVFV